MRNVWLITFPAVLALVAGCEAQLTGGNSSGGLSPGDRENPNTPDNPSGDGDSWSSGGGTGQDPSEDGPLPLTLDSGRTTLRRLTRAEYSNTMADLLGTSQRPGDALPVDEMVEGMDSVGSALSFALIHLETMEGTTAELLDEVFARSSDDPKRSVVLICEPSPEQGECTRQILSTFARRAFRRPVLEPEVDALVDLVSAAQQAGNGFEESLKAGLQAILLSPHFIFRVELNENAGSTEPRRLSSHELATRLSYFLWSTMPDDVLDQLADSGDLMDETVLRAQVDRMLSDPRIEQGLTENFAGQWLPLRRLPEVTFDATLFPDFSESLRLAAAQETELFFGTLVKEDLPLGALLTADFTFVDPQLAEHYEILDVEARTIEVVEGSEFSRIQTDGTPRGGILTHASVLMATSQPARTSPVKRGIWVLEQLLCSPPPPVPSTLEIGDLVPSPDATTREVFELHRADPGCASCHSIIDPLGFGLEDFDGIGTYRTTENGQPIDASGVLNDVPFVGSGELIPLIAEDERLAECIAQQLLTYGVGRNFHEPAAKQYARALAQHATLAGQDTWRQFITAVVMSEAFQTRRPEAL
jgi:hypothetical protein